MFIQVQGFVGATMLYNNTYTVNNSGSTLINFDYSGIDSVTFTSGEEQFAMDNLTVFVPEPKSLNLILLILPFAVMNWRVIRFPTGNKFSRVIFSIPSGPV